MLISVLAPLILPRKGVGELLYLILVGKVVLSGVLCLKMKLLELDHVLCQQWSQAGCLVVGTHHFPPFSTSVQSFCHPFQPGPAKIPVPAGERRPKSQGILQSQECNSCHVPQSKAHRAFSLKVRNSWEE